ncbi:aminotransferase class I/II-fold pyridoxal phosphate-dependent enzyme [Alicyclobacillaceae bacterium I2511]|nr:aminotransferase class I/II-fold pyridoxal phosphate-dependent enzyme [Alicyclobacillaceae bacterium I2511]
MFSPPFNRIIQELPASTPFVGPETLERQLGTPFALRLGANESPFGMSLATQTAMVNALSTTPWYGDPEAYDLRAQLAKLHHLPMEHVAVGSGIDEILGWIVRIFVQPKDPVAASLGGYPTFQYHVRSFGAHLELVPYRSDFTNDLQGLLQAVVETKAHVLYLANPDNPTGTYLTPEVLEPFIRSLPADCILILDEAYLDFVPPAQQWPITDLYPQVLRLRTFSKIYGMAGARIGYVLAHPEIILAFNKIRNHFGVNRPALAGALAALADVEFMHWVRQENSLGRADYEQMAQAHGIASIPSSTNFVSFNLKSKERAQTMLHRLTQLGVFVRTPGGAPPLDLLLRITVGTFAQRQQLQALFAAALSAT